MSAGEKRWRRGFFQQLLQIALPPKVSRHHSAANWAEKDTVPRTSCCKIWFGDCRPSVSHCERGKNSTSTTTLFQIPQSNPTACIINKIQIVLNSVLYFSKHARQKLNWSLNRSWTKSLRFRDIRCMAQKVVLWRTQSRPLKFAPYIAYLKKWKLSRWKAFSSPLLKDLKLLVG